MLFSQEEGKAVAGTKVPSICNIVLWALLLSHLFLNWKEDSISKQTEKAGSMRIQPSASPRKEMCG